jgi:hypothetical protein
MTDTQKFVAGWNLPGCLPEMEPAVFDSEEAGLEFIKEEMRFVSGSDLIGPDDPYVYWVEPLVEDTLLTLRMSMDWSVPLEDA